MCVECGCEAFGSETGIIPVTINDVSSLFYINEEYEGGELNFPDQNLLIKPKKGTFIFFRGEESLMHEVKVVKSGSRNAFVGFFWPTRVRLSVIG